MRNGNAIQRTKTAIAIVVIALTACACATSGNPTSPQNASTTQPANYRRDLSATVYRAAETLGDRAEAIDRSRPIIVSTIVSVSDLEKSSTFGRLVSQLVANRLQQRGFLIRDITFMRAVEMHRDTGELVLTRDAQKASASANAQAVVAGTYAVGGSEIYLNLKLIDSSSGMLLSSVDAVLPQSDNISGLFEAETPGTKLVGYERFIEMARKSQLEFVP